MNPFLSLRNYEEFVYTLPLHKHIFPDIKHHRIPAPDMSFTHPNYSRNRGVAKGMNQIAGTVSFRDMNLVERRRL